jgi:hypothetical protein
MAAPERVSTGDGLMSRVVLELRAGGLLGFQERENRTLLTRAQMTATINAASGERAIPRARVEVAGIVAGPEIDAAWRDRLGSYATSIHRRGRILEECQSCPRH